MPITPGNHAGDQPSPPSVALVSAPPAGLSSLATPSFQTLPPELVTVLAQLGWQATLGAPRNPVLVQVQDVAAVLGVTCATVYRWAHEGRIPCVHAGRKVRFEIDRVVAALRSDGPNAPARRPRPRQAPRPSPTAPPPKLAPRRTQTQVAAKRIKAPPRQDPMDEMARRRAAKSAVKALTD